MEDKIVLPIDTPNNLDALSILLNKPLYQQIIIILVLVGSIMFIAWFFVRLIKSFKGNLGVFFTRRGTEIFKSEDISDDQTTRQNDRKHRNIKKDELTVIEKQLFSVVDDNLKRKDTEIAELKAMVSILQKQVQDLEIENRVRQKEEITRDKNLIPLAQHEVFVNISAMIEPGIMFKDMIMSPEKKIVIKTFIEECWVPLFRDKIKGFVDLLTSCSAEDCMRTLYTLPEKIYEGIEECYHSAKEVRISLPNGRFIIGVPPVFIERFKEWSKSHTYLLVKKVKGTIYSSFYRTWQMRMIVILDLFDTYFALTKEDLEATVVSLNGEMEKAIKEYLVQPH